MWREAAPAAVIYTRSRPSRLKRVLREVLRRAELLILEKAVWERERERGDVKVKRAVGQTKGEEMEHFPLPSSPSTATSSSPTNFSHRSEQHASEF